MEQEKLQFLLQWQQEAAKVRCPANVTSTPPPRCAIARAYPGVWCGDSRACGAGSSNHMRDIRAGAIPAL